MLLLRAADDTNPEAESQEYIDVSTRMRGIARWIDLFRMDNVFFSHD